MKHRKVFTDQQKAEIIDLYLSTDESSRSLGKRYGIDSATILLWAKNYKEEFMGQKSKEVKVAPSSKKEKAKDLELQRLRKELAHSQLVIKVLEKTIEKASEVYGEDIKKKLDTK